MVSKSRNIFLYLAVACFLGISAIFIVDGYMGIYDTVYITAGGQEQTIEADFWLREYNVWSTGLRLGERASFRYQIDNRRFSAYSADIEVSLWHSQQKVASLVSQEIHIAPFAKGQLEWELDISQLDSVPEEGSAEYSVVIKRDGLERRIILHSSKTIPPVPVSSSRSEAGL